MRRARSVPVAGKPSPSSSQGVADSNNLSSALFLFLHRSSLFRSFSNHEAVATNPTSILELKRSPFAKRQPKPPPLELQSAAQGLAILDALIDDKDNGKLVLFGSQLKVRIQSMESPRSPIEFGVKNKDSLRALVSHGRALSPGVFNAVSVSATELEKLENYTCVIWRGPNPKTTHIFDDCCVSESHGDHEYTACRKNTSCVLGNR